MGGDRQGSEYYAVHIRDLATGKDTGEVIADTADGGSWAPDGRSIYYTEFDDNHRPYRVRRHVLGTAQSADAVVFEEADPGFFVGVGETLSRAFMAIDVHDHQTSEVWLIGRDGGAPRLVSARQAEREYDIEERNGVLYILTNADGAEDFKIVTAPVDTPDAEHWVDLVPHAPGVLILDFILLANHLVRLERVEGLPRMVVRDLRDDREWTVKFEEEAYSLGMAAGFEFDVNTIRFTYSSPTTPQQTYELNLDTRRAGAAQAAGGAERARSGGLCDAADFCAGGGWRDRAGDAALSQGHGARRQRPCPALWLRGLRDIDAGGVLGIGAVAGRSRLRLCDGAHPGRDGEGLSLVSARAARAQGQQLQRLHRSG